MWPILFHQTYIFVMFDQIIGSTCNACWLFSWLPLPVHSCQFMPISELSMPEEIVFDIVMASPRWADHILGHLNFMSCCLTRPTYLWLKKCVQELNLGKFVLCLLGVRYTVEVLIVECLQEVVQSSFQIHAYWGTPRGLWWTSHAPNVFKIYECVAP